MRSLVTLSLTAGLLLSTTGAVALMFNQQQVETAEHWTSLELSLGEERYFRATNLADYADTAFSVDFVPPACTPAFELRVDMGEIAARDDALEASGALRVDTRPPHSGAAELTRERGDSGAYAGLGVAAPYRLIHELHIGDTLRLELDDGVEPWHLAFRLTGAAQAIDRAARLCREAAPDPQSPGETPDAYFR